MSDSGDLDQVLAARDSRWMKLRQYIAKEQGIVVSASMNIPGTGKDTLLVNRAFDLALQDLFLEYGSGFLLPLEKGGGAAGPYAFFLSTSSKDAEKVKGLLVSFELSHPIGRWLDLDVWRSDGSAVRREDVGVLSRRCFLCGEDAKVCARSRRHSVEELRRYTDLHLDSYVHHVL